VVADTTYLPQLLVVLVVEQEQEVALLAQEQQARVTLVVQRMLTPMQVAVEAVQAQQEQRTQETQQEQEVLVFHPQSTEL
jgi:hypothetical protein